MAHQALALLSGGLDSSLAIKLVTRQGVAVRALHFVNPFSLSEPDKARSNRVERVAGNLGVELKTVFVGQEFLAMIKNPKYGYGKNLNPCLDCRILFLQKAKQIMQDSGASFIITGEVLGQRPKSQHKQALRTVERQSGLEGLLVRPLSAKLLPPTRPEQEGWLDRAGLGDIWGRSRKMQLSLAASLGITEYAAPAGGCLLTCSSFCRKLSDLISYDELNLNDVELLKAGRHFRLSASVKLAVGRNEQENERLLTLLKEGDIYFEPKDLPGPSAVGRGRFDQELKALASRIVARYTDGSSEVKVAVRLWPGTQEELFIVSGLDQEGIASLRK